MKKHIGVFILFALLALMLYWPTLGAGIVTDQLGWVEQYQKLGWQGMFSAFTDKSLHLVYHIVGYTLWALFGLNAKAWGLVFVGLHSLAATLSFVFFSHLLRPFVKANIIAFIASLLFLTSPYQTEPLVWYACVHYLVCACLLLVALISFLKYVETNNSRFILLFYACYITAVFTLEISFTLPVVLLLLILFFPFNKSINKLCLIGTYVLPSLLAVIGYFVLNKLFRGNFAGHYGAAAHFNADINLLMGNLSKYTAKLFLWAQFIPYDKRSVLYAFFEKQKYGYLLFGCIAIIVLAYLAWYRRLPKTLNVALLLLACFVLALGPILNLYMYFITNVEGDRFSYWASIFAYATIAFVLIVWLRTAGMVIAVLLLGLNFVTIQTNIKAWHHVREVSKGLVASFNYYDAPKIYLLNTPDNYDGAYMFRSFAPDNAFAETVELQTDKVIEDRIVGLLQYNMHSPQDAVDVQIVNDSTLQISFAQYGNWWWKHGMGAGSYEEDDYKIELRDDGFAYTVTFKHKQPGAIYLYQCGNKWYRLEGF